MNEAQTIHTNEPKKGLNKTVKAHKIVMDFTIPPSHDDMEALAAEILEFIPIEFKKYLGDFSLIIEEFPDLDIEEELDLESPYDQLAYYKSLEGSTQITGVASTTKSDADILILYRRPILDLWCENEQDIKEILRNIIFHELGEHCGFNDNEVERMIDESF